MLTLQQAQKYLREKYKVEISITTLRLAVESGKLKAEQQIQMDERFLLWVTTREAIDTYFQQYRLGLDLKRIR